MKFKYEQHGSVLRPIIPIVLKNGTAKSGYHVLVDSGADICLFHAELGERLGLDIQKGKPIEVFGVGGKTSLFYLHPVMIEIGGWEYKIEAGFMPQVGMHAMPYGIVGQKGFFENFIVKFDLRKEEVEIQSRDFLKKKSK